MMTIKQRSEMAIPTWSGEVIVGIVVCVILVFASLVAVLNLLFQVAITVSCVWLAIMAWYVWSNCKGQGDFRKCYITILGLFARKQFVESICQGMGSVTIQFGYQLFGRRVFYFTVPLDKIETVEWRPGQAPKYWNVFVWFDHDDPEKSVRERKWSRKPDQDIYVVGPSRRKQKTEAFGLAFVDFLRCAGADLVRGEDDHTFVRATHRTTEDVERLST